MRRMPITAMLTLLFSVSSSNSLAQSGGTANQSTSNGRSVQVQRLSSGRPGTAKEIYREKLSRWPAVPFTVPPDAKFMSGYRSQYANTKLVTEVRFKSANKLAVLSDWYLKTLTGTGWTLGPSTDKRVQAFKGDIVCTLTFLESTTDTPTTTTVWANYSGDR